MKEKSKKQISGRWKFLIFICFLYFLAFLFNKETAKEAVAVFAATFVGVSKILIIVFTVIFFVNFLIKPEIIKKHLGKESGFRGWMYSMLGSIFVSGPPYVLFPFLGQLKRHGARLSLLVIFLNNRNVQPVFLPVMIFYFGAPFAVIVSVYILIFSSINGWVMEKTLEG